MLFPWQFSLFYSEIFLAFAFCQPWIWSRPAITRYLSIPAIVDQTQVRPASAMHIRRNIAINQCFWQLSRVISRDDTRLVLRLRLVSNDQKLRSRSTTVVWRIYETTTSEKLALLRTSMIVDDIRVSLKGEACWQIDRWYWNWTRCLRSAVSSEISNYKLLQFHFTFAVSEI